MRQFPHGGTFPTFSKQNVKMPSNSLGVGGGGVRGLGMKREKREIYK